MPAAVQLAEPALACGEALLRGLTVPFESLSVILPDAESARVQPGKAAHGRGEPLPRGHAVPDGTSLRVIVDEMADKAHRPHQQLRVHVAALCTLPAVLSLLRGLRHAICGWNGLIRPVSGFRR